MPTPPVPISRHRLTRQRFWDEAETPSKLPRPFSRRRGAENAFGLPQLPSLASVSSCGTVECFSLDLPRALLAQILALLDVPHILRVASVCAGWRRAANSGELWSVATPGLSLAERVVHRSPVSQRRSRGTIVRGTLLGKERQEVALRSLDCRYSNAGHFDGILPSIVREVSFLHQLNRLQHPGIVRMVDVEVVQNVFHLAMEWIPFNFSIWFKRVMSRLQLQEEIRSIHRQLLSAVNVLHSHGIFHRNICPMNVLVDKSGTAKLCDLAHGRSLDAPAMAYTPQENNERLSSGREMIRRCYMAPERILRKEIYGSAVDIWSIGCLMGEAGLQQPLFCAADEVELLFLIFRFLGTPGPDLWPEAKSFKNYSAKFPIYRPFDLRLAGRFSLSTAEEVALWQELRDHRSEVLDKVSKLGLVLETSGMELLGRLLSLEPSKRPSARDALQSSFLHQPKTRIECRRRSRSRSLDEDERRVRQKSQHSSNSSQTDGSLSGLYASQEMPSQSQATPATALAQILSRFQLGDSGHRKSDPPVSDSYWPPLWAEMARQDQHFRDLVMTRNAQVAAMSQHVARMTTFQVDRMLRLTKQLQMVDADTSRINDNTLHLAVSLLYDFTSLQTKLDPELAEIACTKLAESMSEVSNEYYKRERCESFARTPIASQGRWSREDILRAESVVFQRLQARLHRPTAAWFLHSSLAVGECDTQVRNLAQYINTLSLYDPNMQDQPAALRAGVLATCRLCSIEELSAQSDVM